ncbi:hypothetical protein BN1232_06129 [Mycobacterium lentiflavum]|uniref:Uncharacterized protein n=1 Tax=Mycobacterium lentiflavum TaxID=141349 RepID=A0A0E4H200_MYCLN|nr:hypothetical protein [Mycobacterium lentiflavum]CQD24260.1 hypothetical protein BN1232_06129 [Mycobacterium lentiflavum]
MTASAQTIPDIPDIDDLSVIQVVDDGMRLRLNGRERDEAVRRMHRRIDTDLIAWRLYITPRTVQRVVARLGLSEPAA